MVAELNHTHIALIPKIKVPKTVVEFRPISLCNVLYKLISKVLTNRVKKVLHATISQNKSAFIADKLITNNIMVAFELLHSMQSKQKGKTGNMAIKIDMEKTFDYIE